MTSRRRVPQTGTSQVKKNALQIEKHFQFVVRFFDLISICSAFF